MCRIVFCLAAIVPGIDVGWQPLPDGGLQYIIQIEPEMLETLRAGEPIESDLPPDVRDVRAYRIIVGNDELPRQSPAPQPAEPDKPTQPEAFPPTEPQAMTSEATPIPRLPAVATASGPESVPKELPPDSSVRPLGEQSAAPLEQGNAKADDSKETESQEKVPGRPWPLLMGTVIALFASLGGNVYLGWVIHDARSRYRALISRMRQDDQHQD